MKEAIIMSKEEYRSIVNKINDMEIDLVRLTDLLNEARKRADRFYRLYNQPAIDALNKAHDDEYLAWCEEISAKYEEANYLAWCEETAKKYDDMYWAKIWNCDPEDLKWIAWAKEYSREAIAIDEEERAFYDWERVCKHHFHVDREDNMAYRALYNYYYFYNYKDTEWWFDQYKWWLDI